jgi:hypothetical protein
LNLCWIQSLALSLPGIDWIILFLAADSDAQGVHRLSKTAGKPSCIQVMTAIFRAMAAWEMLEPNEHRFLFETVKFR